MNDHDSIPATLDPAITPAFLDQIEQLDQQPRYRDHSGAAWSTYLFSVLTQHPPQRPPQPPLPPVSPLR